MENKKLNISLDEFFELEEKIKSIYWLRELIIAIKRNGVSLSGTDGVHTYSYNSKDPMNIKIIELLEKDFKEKAELYGIEI